MPTFHEHCLVPVHETLTHRLESADNPYGISDIRILVLSSSGFIDVRQLEFSRFFQLGKRSVQALA